MPTPAPAVADAASADGPSVAACPDCGRLFALAGDPPPRVACPACGAVVAIADLTPQTLAYAAEAPAEPAPETEPATQPAPAIRITVDPPSEGIEATVVDSTDAPGGDATIGPSDDTLPTVADWLQKSERASPLPDKPSLAKSLGWDPGSFRLDGQANAKPSADPPATNAPTAATIETPTTPHDDFTVELDLSSGALEPDPPTDRSMAGTPAQPSDDRPIASPTDTLFVRESERRSPRWVKPLTALAGVLVVVAPAAWVTQQFGPWADSRPLTSASTNRAARLGDPSALDPQPEEAAVMVAESAPGSGTPIEPSPPREPAPIATQVAAEDTPATDGPEPMVDTATQPASFEQGPPASPVGGRYAAVASPIPAEPVAPAPLPIAPPTDAAQPAAAGAPAEITPLPSIGPRSTIEELAAAIAAAEPARAGFQQGTLADPDQLADMGTHYARLCHLADAITRFDPQSLGVDSATDTTDIEAADVFRRLFRREKPRRESIEIAGPWIEWTDRPHDGVFFAGVPFDVGRAGELYEYRFQLGERVVPMVSAEPIDADRYLVAGGKEMGVIGVVVDRPSERIPGYAGDATRVVWVRKTLPLGDPVAP